MHEKTIKATAVLRMMEDAQKDYAWNYSEVNRMDRLTQDYLHKLELDGLDYKERAKVATSLAKCRQARREYKDMVEILEPLVQFLESDKGKNLLNLVREALGKQVNIVVWLIVIVALVLLWFCLSFAFKGIGAFGLRIYNDAKKEISEESEEKSEKTTEELKDEG